MLNKTKAALQSCQCHYGIFKQSQHTRVNAGGQNFTQLNFEDAGFTQLLWQSVKLRFVPKSLIVKFLPALGETAGKFALQHNQKVKFLIKQQTSDLRFTYKPLIFSTPSLWFIDSWSYKNSGAQPLGSSLAFLRWRFFSPFSTLSDSVLVGLLVGTGGREAGFWVSVMSHPFGSIPSRSRRWRQESLTHELKFPCPATESICLSSASSKRMFFTVLLERSNSRFVFFSCIGIYHRCSVFADGIYHLILNQVLKTAKPGSARTLTGPLTTNR
ncbi:hypothetical protein [Klebsiella variicola]|uniref:hypothetical protein n=1 Tax=Klebsiella variicola TaxID=244366 RepID=UPI00205303DB|nr:MAG TPA: hypothetical protein [Caudoviricetes sp.]